jgi:hypothetical protein
MLESKKDQHDNGKDERQLEEAAEKPEKADGGKDDKKDGYPILGHETGNGIHRNSSMCYTGLLNMIPL